MAGSVAPVEVDPAPAPAAAAPSESVAPEAGLLGSSEGDASATTSSEGSKPSDAAPEEGNLPPSLLAEESEGKPATDSQADGDGGSDPKADYQPFTLPDGMILNETALAKAMPIFKELKLDQDSAQKLVSFHAEEVKQAIETAGAETYSKFVAEVAEWQKASLSDPEIGGDKFKESRVSAKRALALADKDFLPMLDQWGLSSHPLMLRFLTRVGQKLSQDSLVLPDATSQTSSEPKKPWEVLYGNSMAQG